MPEWRPARRSGRSGRQPGCQSGGSSVRHDQDPKPKVTDEALERVFHAYDGLTVSADTSSFRLYDFYQQLSARGVDTHLTGDGGVLHKDWEWMQDLPFYNKRTTNLKRFYEQRLAFNLDSRNSGPLIIGELDAMSERVIAGLGQYVRATNTQSYDMLYYHVNGRRDRLYSQRINGVSLYAPLMERDFVSSSYALPRRRQLFYNHMRILTTGQDAAIARIPTVYETTASNDWNFLLRDSAYQIVDYGRKAVRMAGRRFLGPEPAHRYRPRLHQRSRTNSETYRLVTGPSISAVAPASFRAPRLVALYLRPI